LIIIAIIRNKSSRKGKKNILNDKSKILFNIIE